MTLTEGPFRREPGSRWVVARAGNYETIGPVVRAWFRFRWRAVLYRNHIRRQPGFSDFDWQVHSVATLDRATRRRHAQAIDEMEDRVERRR